MAGSRLADRVLFHCRNRFEYSIILSKNNNKETEKGEYETLQYSDEHFCWVISYSIQFLMVKDFPLNLSLPKRKHPPVPSCKMSNSDP